MFSFTLPEADECSCFFGCRSCFAFNSLYAALILLFFKISTKLCKIALHWRYWLLVNNRDQFFFSLFINRRFYNACKFFVGKFLNIKLNFLANFNGTYTGLFCCTYSTCASSTKYGISTFSLKR